MSTDYALPIARELKLRTEQAAAAIELLDAGNTLPFIARYRKEATGALDEDQLRQLTERLEHLRALDERRQTILAEIEKQGALTPELRQQVLAASSRTALEDLYQPYKPKRRTRASLARDKGLQGLADLIVKQPVYRAPMPSLAQLAQPFLGDKVPTSDDAWAGARDIVAEVVSDHAQVRRSLRTKAQQWGTLTAEKVADAVDERGVYQTYYAFSLRVDRLRPHQVLALNRGEGEKVLRVKLEVPERDVQAAMETAFRPDPRSPLAVQLTMALADAATRLLLPAIERDVRRELTEQAENHAIGVFAANLRALLRQPPLAGHTVLGLDPGFRTGCKVAVVDPTGKVLTTDTIYPHEPQKDWRDALKTLGALILRHGVTLIAIGNGTASRETERLAAELTRAMASVKYLMVNEAGASIYSASPLARAELPGLDVSLRGAVSIARRVQDPLAELVKIDPQSIGVGLYQHDVDQARLKQALGGVVESVVNQVGVDANTASSALLAYVAGVGPKLAEKIVAYRDEHGRFAARAEFRKVSGLGPKAFEQAAGFLRVLGGAQPLDAAHPLDATAIHPESYGLAEAALKRAGLTVRSTPAERQAALARWQPAQLAAELGAGVPTLTDILEQLVRPGRDPRQDLPAPILRSDVLSMDDLLPGLRLSGTVRNVVDFGAFVDIGVKQDGLLHRSQIPRDAALEVGDVIEVEIQKVEPERGRIALGWASGQ